MAGATDGLFATVQMGSIPAIWEQPGEVNTWEVLKMLELSNRDAAALARVPVNSIKRGIPIPEDLATRVLEWAVMLEVVAGFFEGDVDKTVLWFKLGNPLLGGLTPREMIRFGRAQKLREIIQDALAGNLP